MGPWSKWIHINDDADDLTRDKSHIPFLGSKLGNSIPKCDKSLVVKDWWKERLPQ
jgi:hypothetical protein